MKITIENTKNPDTPLRMVGEFEDGGGFISFGKNLSDLALKSRTSLEATVLVSCFDIVEDSIKAQRLARAKETLNDYNTKFINC